MIFNTEYENKNYTLKINFSVFMVSDNGVQKQELESKGP